MKTNYTNQIHLSLMCKKIVKNIYMFIESLYLCTENVPIISIVNIDLTTRFPGFYKGIQSNSG